ncbi:ferrochelatase [Marinospirillum alkaliphilum]|uniref:Ferrochelatase n=1 Tax=Marinospirillum alkaliphilum DSM 21637 TaxID=1122209 RepID=A0A1K1ZGA1_9GAMM|nr:ferrochelatase [Marinospirillum alkaliphilum]SFX73142.1 ferrochelatase [Marinospirillum alkaliphilum DSM 21637]
MSQKKVSQKKPPFAVMLVNLGTPDAPTPAAVRKYLAEFLWDRRVVDVPRPLWWMILHGIILRTRPGRVAHNYQQVWTEQGSPLLAISRQQQQALQARLQDELGETIPVLLAMTYGSPSMEDAGRELRRLGVERLLVLPLYPQFSATTTAAAFDRLAASLKRCPHWPELRFIRDYHQHPAYIRALAQSVRQAWHQQGQEAAKLVMSFHGIPERYARQGDPYPRHCEATAKALADELGLRSDQWLLTYQSRFGKEPWLQPYTDATLEQLGSEKLRGLSVICPGFSADCLETLEEIEGENREIFEQAGGSDFSYVPALNDRPEHIQMMVELVLQHSQGW